MLCFYLVVRLNQVNHLITMENHGGLGFSHFLGLCSLIQAWRKAGMYWALAIKNFNCFGLFLLLFPFECNKSRDLTLAMYKIARFMTAYPFNVLFFTKTKRFSLFWFMFSITSKHLIVSYFGLAACIHWLGVSVIKAGLFCIDLVDHLLKVGK